MDNLKPGGVLIADPFLKDLNFIRSVIFLCEHRSEEGSLGFVINHKCNKSIGELVTDLAGCDFAVYYGGPVQMNTIHFLHRCPHLITEGTEIIDGIYWGSTFAEAADLIKHNKINSSQIRFYIGYSGWAEKQLQSEVEEKTWLITYGNKRLVFNNNTEQIWPNALKQIGGEYEQLINYPLDPQLN